MLCSLLGQLFAGLGGPAAPPGMRGMGPMDGPPSNPFQAMLRNLMDPANAASGDAVFTQEAFDRVISQFMDENQSSSAPGPASSAAIAALPKQGVTTAMLGDSGTAECSICMDNVVKGEEVTVLPCKHWFHGQCIEAWLREHDTCPVCRTGITPRDGPQNTARSPTQAPLHNRDPFELIRTGSGTAQHPFELPESPTAERRQPNTRRSSSGFGGSRRLSRTKHERGESNGSSVGERVRSFFNGGGSNSTRRPG
ncbi:hypothetical protein MRB53_040352 [Persea americana]|nr:hypothetical protein MRB53_040352 [Persea americana]